MPVEAIILCDAHAIIKMNRITDDENASFRVYKSRTAQAEEKTEQVIAIFFVTLF